MNLPKKIDKLAAWEQIIKNARYEDYGSNTEINMRAIAVEVSIIEERINQLIEYLEEQK